MSRGARGKPQGTGKLGRWEKPGTPGKGQEEAEEPGEGQEVPGEGQEESGRARKSRGRARKRRKSRGGGQEEPEEPGEGQEEAKEPGEGHMTEVGLGLGSPGGSHCAGNRHASRQGREPAGNGPAGREGVPGG